MKNILIFYLFFVYSTLSFAKFSKELVQGDFGIPWGMVDLGDSLLITERSGKLKLFDWKTKKVINVSGVPDVFARGQGGLLDIKLHPNFKMNKRVYLSYSKKLDDRKTTALGFGELINNKLKNFKDIFIAKGKADKRIHFGSRITFNSSSQLFLSIGDRGVRDNAQSLLNHYGKIIRINDDGSIPKDNPFYNQKNSLPEIWSYGHRNPQGFFYHENSKTLYEMEHGPRGGDEINIVEKGKNYGWPTISYGKEYMLPVSVGEGTHKKGLEQPIKYYVPSIAPSDLIYYQGKKYPSLNNTLISGALRLTHINIFNPQTKKEFRIFEDDDMRIRSILERENGDILFGTDDGKIFKLIEGK